MWTLKGNGKKKQHLSSDKGSQSSVQGKSVNVFGIKWKNTEEHLAGLRKWTGKCLIGTNGKMTWKKKHASPLSAE